MFNEQEVRDKILEKTISFIAYTPRTVKEVSDRLGVYLSKEDISEEERSEIKEYVLEQVDGMKLLDDERYSKDYVRGKLRIGKPISRMELNKFLYSKGVSTDLIDSALQLYSEDDEKNFIEELVDKKYSSMKDIPAKKAKSKLISYLFTKGYNSSIIYAVVDTKLSLE